MMKAIQSLMKVRASRKYTSSWVCTGAWLSSSQHVYCSSCPNTSVLCCRLELSWDPGPSRRQWDGRAGPRLRSGPVWDRVGWQSSLGRPGPQNVLRAGGPGSWRCWPAWGRPLRHILCQCWMHWSCRTPRTIAVAGEGRLLLHVNSEGGSWLGRRF